MKIERSIEDIADWLAERPFKAVGAAFAIGAIIALRPRRAKAERGLMGAAFAGLAALAVQAAKDYAVREASDKALQWWDRRRSGSSSEDRTSRDPNVEPFLEH
jgi:hypothetical protein